MIKKFLEAIGGALAAVWEYEAVRAIAKVVLVSFAVIGMVVLAALALTGWVYLILLMIHG